MFLPTDDKIVITLTDEMDDNELFDYPLTVKVNVPDEWKQNVKFTQGDTSKAVEIFEENGRKYVYAKIVPDSGNAVLSIK